ncbi:hypothetical protein IE53DRAFT_396666 [Violaceomyces palustris]|uniref:Uncharacterized protein n=1 Tax=Violaceomyces palustris TaxID=1673888 RepID=A0ACD0NVT8_9BASI|nr:hypothetical protein IE53DRAFT_396666 [Violaceomyces palustris]
MIMFPLPISSPPCPFYTSLQYTENWNTGSDLSPTIYPITFTNHLFLTSAQVGTTKKTVANTQSNFNTRGHCYRTFSPGRPTQTTERNNRHILRTIFQHPSDSWKQILGRLEGVSRYRLRKVANEAGIRRCVAIRKPVLTTKHTGKHLEWAKTNKGRNWNMVLFTDESGLEVGSTDRQVRVSRRSGEAYLPRNMTPTFRSGHQSLMVWASMAYNFKTPLFHIPLAPSRVERSARIRAEGLNAQRYTDLVIKGPLKAAWDVLKTFSEGYEVVEDDTPCHSGLVAWQAREEVGIRHLDHPSASLDLNPIENVWMVLKTRINRVWPIPTSLDELFMVARKVWDEIKMEIINGCFESMSRRVSTLVAIKGKSLKY